MKKQTGICKYIRWTKIDRTFREVISKAKKRNYFYLRNDPKSWSKSIRIVCLQDNYKVAVLFNLYYWTNYIHILYIENINSSGLRRLAFVRLWGIKQKINLKRNVSFIRYDLVFFHDDSSTTSNKKRILSSQVRSFINVSIHIKLL